MRKSITELYADNRKLTCQIYNLQSTIRELKKNEQLHIAHRDNINELYTRITSIIDCFSSPIVPLMSRFVVVRICLFNLLELITQLKKSYEQKNR